jgi:hypothetical protein
MHERPRAAGVASELVLIPGSGQGNSFSSDPLSAYWRRTEDFLTRRLAAGC